MPCGCAARRESIKRVFGIARQRAATVIARAASAAGRRDASQQHIARQPPEAERRTDAGANGRGA